MRNRNIYPIRSLSIPDSYPWLSGLLFHSWAQVEGYLPPMRWITWSYWQARNACFRSLSCYPCGKQAHACAGDPHGSLAKFILTFFVFFMERKKYSKELYVHTEVTSKSVARSLMQYQHELTTNGPTWKGVSPEDAKASLSPLPPPSHHSVQKNHCSFSWIIQGQLTAHFPCGNLPGNT